MRDCQSTCIPECLNRINVSFWEKSLFGIIRDVGELSQVPEQRHSVNFPSDIQSIPAKFKSQFAGRGFEVCSCDKSGGAIL